MEPKESLGTSFPALKFQHVIHKGISRVNRIKVGHGPLRPYDACLGSRPNPKKRSSIRKRKPPTWNKVWHRRTEDVNKELTDDLSGRLTIKVGRFLIWAPSRYAIRQKKERAQRRIVWAENHVFHLFLAPLAAYNPKI
jgi:hypothetical protein